MMQCVWNNVRAMVRAPTPEPSAIAVKEEESESMSEPIRRPTFFTGELPQNAIVDISAYIIAQIRQSSWKLSTSHQ